MSYYIGVDVARYGSDATAFALWDGPRLDGVQTVRNLDTMAVADHVAGLIATHEPKRVCVDVIGIGSGVVDKLRKDGHRAVEGVNVGAGSRDPDKFKNLRAELFWRFRESLQRGEMSLPNDRDLFEELMQLRYFYLGTGALQIESKEDMRKRLGRSPDRADAVVLGWWAQVGTGQGHVCRAYSPAAATDSYTFREIEDPPPHAQRDRLAPRARRWGRG
jgi:phage terminase large subunit